LAGTVETMFVGWELVGLSSALLVAFFHERPAPCRNGLRIWGVYRISDAALLIASLAKHHLHGHGDFRQLLGNVSWPDGQAVVPAGQALFIGLLLIVAAAGKSALVPFSGWLPRAMEGPTPSSAVFYGALSVHLGAFLLLRFSPLLALSPALAVVIIVLGLTTALFAGMSARVQTDIKCALCFASLTQVGLIIVEIGVGLYVPFFQYVALVHILGHACLRTLQFLRAPTLLHDYRILENAIGGRLSPVRPLDRVVPAEHWQTRIYRLAIDRGHLDALLDAYVVRPFLAVFRACDRMERAWAGRLSGVTSSHRAAPRRHTPSVTDE
jgi:NAD(P)H-quinone oxidoreductase subunit 5